MSQGDRGRVNTPIVALTAAAWLVLLVGSSTSSLAHCAVTDAGASEASFQMLLAMNPVSSLAAGWALMLVAMMLPTLSVPIEHVVERNFKRRRARAVALFLGGYGSVWMLAGAALVAAQLALSLFFPRSYLPAAAVFVIALLWQCSPIKQLCLNRKHNHRALSAFGLQADLDALRFGGAHGAWCVLSCWALMLFPMLLPVGHFAAMAAVTVVIVSEHLDHPRALGWRLRGPGKLVRIVVAQSRIRLQALLSAPTRSSSRT